MYTANYMCKAHADYVHKRSWTNGDYHAAQCGEVDGGRQRGMLQYVDKQLQ